MITAIDSLIEVSNVKQNIEEFISNAIFSAFMMTNLINDLLDLGKLENCAF